MGGSGGRLSMRNVENVQLATGRWLRDRLTSWIMGDMIAIDDVVVPVSLALFERLSLKAECAFPTARLGGILGKR